MIVVLLKHRFLGDAIVATPLLSALDECYPGSEKVVVTGAGAAQLLQNHPAVDRLLTYGSGTAERSRAGSRRLLQAAWQRAGELRQNRPKQAFVVDRSLRAALVAWRMGAQDRIGFNTEGRGLLLTRRIPYQEERPETECALDLLRAVLPGSYDSCPRLYLTQQERQQGAGILPPGAGPLIGLQPGASHDYKQWPLEYLAALAERLVHTHNARLVLFGGPEERPAAEALQARLPLPVAADLTGKTGLRETMGALANLDLFFGNDTGVNHIAAALGTATVALFGPTPAQKWSWRGERNRSLIAPDGAMANIPPERAYQSVAELLSS